MQNKAFAEGTYEYNVDNDEFNDQDYEDESSSGE